MGTKTKARRLRGVLENTDDILKILTGKRLKNIVGTGVNLFGEELVKKVANFFTGNEEPELPADSPYLVLGLHPGAMNVAVKGAFRALAREYHPDTGTSPDPVKFQAATEAYDTIMKERRERKEKECAPGS